MKHRVWVGLVASTGCAALIAGCGGSALDIPQAGAGSVSFGGKNADAPGGQSAIARGGSGNGGSGTAGAGNSTAVAGEGGAAGAAPCVGTSEQVPAIWGDCPATLCAGLAWAESCTTISLRPTTLVGTCGWLKVITLDYALHGQACYYDLRSNGEPKLVGAAVWDDVQDHCNGTSFSIEYGITPANAGCTESKQEVVCDGWSDTADASGGAGGEAGTGSGDTPPKASHGCFNAFSNSCEPCCPTVECTGKPDGYPGYGCTPAANSFCECTCSHEAWSCAC